MAELELVDRANWYELYRRKADDTHWRLDADDKYQQRFLVRIDELASWHTYDSSPLEKALLLDRRRGVGEERCLRQDCAQLVLKGLAFCLDHTFERGVRK